MDILDHHCLEQIVSYLPLDDFLPLTMTCQKFNTEWMWGLFICKCHLSSKKEYIAKYQSIREDMLDKLKFLEKEGYEVNTELKSVFDRKAEIDRIRIEIHLESMRLSIKNFCMSLNRLGLKYGLINNPSVSDLTMSQLESEILTIERNILSIIKEKDNKTQEDIDIQDTLEKAVQLDLYDQLNLIF